MTERDPFDFAAAEPAAESTAEAAAEVERPEAARTTRR